MISVRLFAALAEIREFTRLVVVAERDGVTDRAFVAVRAKTPLGVVERFFTVVFARGDVVLCAVARGDVVRLETLFVVLRDGAILRPLSTTRLIVVCSADSFLVGRADQASFEMPKNIGNITRSIFNVCMIFPSLLSRLAILLFLCQM